MSSQPQSAEPSLEAKSPFELRVDLSKNVSQNVIKQALETGDTAFYIPSLPAQPSMALASGSLPGQPAANSNVSIVTIQIRGT